MIETTETQPTAIEPEATPVDPPGVQDGGNDGVQVAAPPAILAPVIVEDADAEADREEALIREVMPLVFDAQDAAGRRNTLPESPEARVAAVTPIARALLARRGVEGAQLDHLAGLIGRGVGESRDEGEPSPATPAAAAIPEEDEPQPEPEPPTLAELAVAVRMGREQVAAALGALATASAEDQPAILARVERLRASLVELEALLPERPAFPQDAEPEARPALVPARTTRVDAPAAPRGPSLVVPGAMLTMGMLLQAGAFAVLALQNRKGD